MSFELLRRHVTTPSTDVEAPPQGWCLGELAGRLTELCGDRASAALTLAFALVHEAQQRGEPVAWIMNAQSSFYPPDVADSGVSLDALVVIRTASATIGARAADQLARSGAFGLLVLDVARAREREQEVVPQAQLSRLLGLAQKHAVAIVFLTARSALGSLISLRAEARRSRAGDAFCCQLVVVKDKRRAPGWTHQEICHGPAGLR